MNPPASGRPVVLIGAEKYLPGWKGGGPIRSLSNLADQLGDAYDLRIVTEDRDRGDDEPYSGITAHSWVPVGKASVYYAPKADLVRGAFRRAVADTAPDLVYLNSLLWRVTMSYLASRRLGRGDRPPLLISPRGELDPGALSIRPRRKSAYLRGARALGLLRGVTWQASTPLEAANIERAVGGVPIEMAANLVAAPPPRAPEHPRKEPGACRLIFVSRVGPKKNLPFLLRALQQVHGTIDLEIHGRKVASEWSTVEGHLEGGGLGHVRLVYAGATPHEEVAAALARAHVFVLPTLAESFGHAVYEALSAGTPAVVSDRTPWRGLEARRAGWDLPLVEDRWVGALQRCVDMGDEEYRLLSAGAHRLAAAWFASSEAKAHQAAVFDRVMAGGDHGAPRPL